MLITFLQARNAPSFYCRYLLKTHKMKKNIVVSTLVLIVTILIAASAFCIAKAPKGDEPTILENGVYFNGKTFVPFKEMILKHGKIASISSVTSKTAGQRVPVNGKYVIPGLIDAHEHISGSPAYPYINADPKYNVNSNLNCGITTVIDLFYPEDGVKAIKQETGKSPEYYSSLIMSGPILTAPGGHGTEYGVPTRTLTSVEEAKKITNEVIDGGVDVIKLVYEADSSNYIPSLTIEMVKAIVDVAHSRNKKVFAHIDRIAQAVACAEVGVDVIAHMPVDLASDEQLRKLKASGAIIIPTITVMQSALEGHDAKYMSDSLLWKTANPVYMDNFSRSALPKPPVPEEKMLKTFGSIHFHENLKDCIKAGIPLLAGTDAGNYAVFYGYSLHNELLQYAAAGMTNAEALCTATQNISMVFPGIKTGEIATGYDADLVILDADPLKDIANTKSIDMVFHKGLLAKMLAPDTTTAKRAPMVYNPAALDINAATLPPWITTFSDKKAGGNSEMNAVLLKDPSGDSYLHLSGKVVKKGYFGFAGTSFGLSMNEDVAPVDISGFKAIEFDVRGNGETYLISLVSSLVKDYNFHSSTFKATKDWQTIKISFDDFKQSPYYGKQIPLDLKTIKAISYTASTTGTGYDIDLDLKNIHLVK